MLFELYALKPMPSPEWKALFVIEWIFLTVFSNLIAALSVSICPQFSISMLSIRVYASAISPLAYKISADRI